MLSEEAPLILQPSIQNRNTRWQNSKKYFVGILAVMLVVAFYAVYLGGTSKSAHGESAVLKSREGRCGFGTTGTCDTMRRGYTPCYAGAYDGNKACRESFGKQYTNGYDYKDGVPVHWTSEGCFLGIFRKFYCWGCESDCIPDVGYQDPNIKCHHYGTRVCTTNTKNSEMKCCGDKTECRLMSDRRTKCVLQAKECHSLGYRGCTTYPSGDDIRCCGENTECQSYTSGGKVVRTQCNLKSGTPVAPPVIENKGFDKQCHPIWYKGCKTYPTKDDIKCCGDNTECQAIASGGKVLYTKCNFKNTAPVAPPVVEIQESSKQCHPLGSKGCKVNPSEDDAKCCREKTECRAIKPHKATGELPYTICIWKRP